MAIRADKFKLIDDSRSFTREQLSSVWEWLDEYDMQPLRSRAGASLKSGPLTFTQDSHTFLGTVYSLARCSDGREILGSPIGVAAAAVNAMKRNLFARLSNA